MPQMQNGTLMQKPRGVYPDLLWAGSEHSLLVALDAHERIMAAYGAAGYRQPEEEQVPYLLKVQGDIGLIDIKGSLVNRDSPYNRYYGVTSYADISRALVYAAQKPEIKGILLDVDSGGGAVNGVADAGNLIATVSKTMKPVWAFSGGGMLSAAYWLGSSAKKVFNSNTATLGSIGVIATLMEFTEMFKEMGVGVKVMRAGKYKALLNPYEKHTDAALERFQNQLDAAYSVFIDHVAVALGVTSEEVDKTMGQGREFFGAQAPAAGLSHGLATFDEVFAKLSAKVLDTKGVTQFQSGQHQRGSQMSREALQLTAEQVAAAQAGVTLPSAAPAAAPAAPAGTTETPAPASETPAAAPAASAPAQSESEIVTFLRAELATAQGNVAKRDADLIVANQRIEAMTKAQADLVEIVGRSLNTMRVPMNLGAVDVSKLSVDALVADHKSLSEQFASKFKVGGVAAAPVPGAEANKVDPSTDPIRRARLAATGI